MHSTSAALLFVLFTTASVGRTMCQTYDCMGSTLCAPSSTPNILEACDNAVNKNLTRNDVVNYGAPGSGKPQTGACAPTKCGGCGSGCGVFLQGPATCTATGNQIWWDYQDIRQAGCKVCGSKHWGGGCLTTINFVAGCES